MKNFTRIFLAVALSMSVLSSPVFAQKYDIKEMTPGVKQALEGRRGRYDELKSLKSSGAVGENNNGYVEVLKNEGNASSIVSSENQDRKIIYQTIADQNNLGGALSTIEKVFAQVQRDKAASGDQIQNEGGAWVSK